MRDLNITHMRLISRCRESGRTRRVRIQPDAIRGMSKGLGISEREVVNILDVNGRCCTKNTELILENHNA